MEIVNKWTVEEWDALEFGDLIMTWLRASDAPDMVTLIVSEAIELFTGGPSHVRFYVDDMAPIAYNPFDYNFMFFEMTSPCGRWGHIQEVDISTHDIAVIRHRGFTHFDEGKMLEACAALTGVKYDYEELFDHLQRIIWEDLVPDAPLSTTVCSTAAELITEASGFRYQPEVHSQLVNPADQFMSIFADVVMGYGDQAIKAFGKRELYLSK